MLRIRGEDPLEFDPHFGVSPRTTTNLSFTHSRLLKAKAGPSVAPGTTILEPDLAESWTQPTETTYVFRLRPTYFVSGLPYADAIEATFEADPASRFASWLGGKYDLAPEYGMVVRRLDLDLARQRKPGLQTAEFTVRFGGIVWMKVNQPPFNDIRVRKAMALARNWREALESNAWSLGHGVANPAIPAAFQEWSIPIAELPPDGRTLYEQNLAEAKRLLAEAGYPNGLKTTLETTADLGPDWMDGVQVFVSQLKAIGIEAELKLKEFGAFISSTVVGRFDHMAVGLFGFFTVPDSYLFLSYTPGLPTNASGVTDAKLVDMIRLQRRTLNVAKRREIVYDIRRYLSQQAYYLYGPSVRAVAAWDRRVKNFAPNVGDDYGGRLMVTWLDR